MQPSLDRRRSSVIATRSASSAADHEVLGGIGRGTPGWSRSGPLPEMIFTATVLLETVHGRLGTSVTSLRTTIRIG